MKRQILFVAAAGVMLAGCAREAARVAGRFTGHAGGMVYLDQVVPGDRRTVDSAELSAKGAFRLKATLPEGETTLYNLRYEGAAIPLMLARGERVEVNSLCDVALNYTVGGSPESERMRELQMLLMHGATSLDSLRNTVFATEGDAQRTAYADYVRELNRIKRAHISFIASEPARLSSLWALYQRLAGEQFLFNAKNDVIYYRLVADSTGVHHPRSPYVASLRREVDKAVNALNVSELLVQKLAEGGDGYPDLTLPDIYGTEHALSALAGKVILLDFWHSADPAARLNNAELRTLYDAFHDRGLEIYQVSLDTRKPSWITAVQSQKLPWTSVGDMRGLESPAAVKYNIARLPANFLIDRTGTIVARDVFNDELRAKIEASLQN